MADNYTTSANQYTTSDSSTLYGYIPTTVIEPDGRFRGATTCDDCAREYGHGHSAECHRANTTLKPLPSADINTWSEWVRRYARKWLRLKDRA